MSGVKCACSGWLVLLSLRFSLLLHALKPHVLLHALETDVINGLKLTEQKPRWKLIATNQEQAEKNKEDTQYRRGRPQAPVPCWACASTAEVAAGRSRCAWGARPASDTCAASSQRLRRGGHGWAADASRWSRRARGAWSASDICAVWGALPVAAPRRTGSRAAGRTCASAVEATAKRTIGGRSRPTMELTKRSQKTSTLPAGWSTSPICYASSRRPEPPGRSSPFRRMLLRRADSG